MGGLMARKIIQISTSTVSNSGYLRGEVVTVITALCEDGTVWWRIKGDGEPSRWSLVDPIPDDGG